MSGRGDGFQNGLFFPWEWILWRVGCGTECGKRERILRLHSASLHFVRDDTSVGAFVALLLGGAAGLEGGRDKSETK